jgi:hypothetical protein
VRVRLSLAAACVAAYVLVQFQITLVAQNAPPAAGAGGPPAPAGPPAGPVTRRPDGKPDLNGYWAGSYNLGLTNIETPRLIVDPPGGKIPYRPEFAAKVADIQAHHMIDEPSLHCAQSGVPHSMYTQFGFQIVQAPDHIVMTWDYLNQSRIVPMDGRPHINEALKLYQGDSIGHWEGDTLVIDTTNLNDRSWFDNVANTHSDALHVVERFTPADANTIRYEASIEDPKAFTMPWKSVETFRRNTKKDWEQMEFGCVEGNRDVEHYPETQGGTAHEAPPAAVPK